MRTFHLSTKKSMLWLPSSIDSSQTGPSTSRVSSCSKPKFTKTTFRQDLSRQTQSVSASQNSPKLMCGSNQTLISQPLKAQLARLEDPAHPTKTTGLDCYWLAWLLDLKWARNATRTKWEFIKADGSKYLSLISWSEIFERDCVEPRSWLTDIWLF